MLVSLQTIEATSKARACSYKPSKTIHDLTKISYVFDLSSFYFQKLEMHIRILVYAMKTKNCQDFCPTHYMAEILTIFRSYFGSFFVQCIKKQLITLQNFNIQTCFSQFLCFFSLEFWFKGQIISRIHLILPNAYKLMCFDRNINGNRDVEFLECDYLLVQRYVKLTLVHSLVSLNCANL